MKVYVASPGQHNWPIIPDDIQERFIELLSETFLDEINLKRTRKTKKKDSSIQNPIKQHLAIGLRCVMRCLKQKQCSFVFVCNSLNPMILTKPILLLSQMHSIPAIRLKNLSNLLTKTFAIPHCSTLALKSSCQENEKFKVLYEQISSIVNGSRNEPANVKFQPGKIIAPYQNPKRVSGGIQKNKKKK